MFFQYIRCVSLLLRIEPVVFNLDALCVYFFLSLILFEFQALNSPKNQLVYIFNANCCDCTLKRKIKPNLICLVFFPLSFFHHDSSSFGVTTQSASDSWTSSNHCFLFGTPSAPHLFSFGRFILIFIFSVSFLSLFIGIVIFVELIVGSVFRSFKVHCITFAWFIYRLLPVLPAYLAWSVIYVCMCVHKFMLKDEPLTCNLLGIYENVFGILWVKLNQLRFNMIR